MIDYPECPECGGYNVTTDDETSDRRFCECHDCCFSWFEDDEDEATQ